MTEDNSWLMMPITSKTTKPQLVDCIRMMPSKYRRGHGSPNTKAEMIEVIEDRRAKYWDAKQLENHSAAQRAHSKTRPSNITAAECNTFLRSLPAPEFA